MKMMWGSAARRLWFSLLLWLLWFLSPAPSQDAPSASSKSGDTPARVSGSNDSPKNAVPVTESLRSLPPALEEVFLRSPQGIEELQLMEAHQRELVERVTPCVVGLQIGQAQGSGVIVSPEGIILTAAHVVQRPGMNVVVIFSDGRRARGVTLGIDRSNDAGMVRIGSGADAASGQPAKVPDKPFPFVPVGDSKALRVGQWVLTLGHHGGYQPGRKPPARIGRVVSLSDDLIVTDAPLVGGDSGGPLFNMKGEVVGIHSRIGGSLAANMHVPTHIFQQGWDRLAKGEMWGEVPRGAPYIGVRGDPDAPDARIAEVEPGQPADRAGLKVGDVVVQFEGREVKTFSDLVAMVAEREPGERVKIVVRRGEELVELQLEIGRRR